MDVETKVTTEVTTEVTHSLDFGTLLVVFLLGMGVLDTVKKVVAAPGLKGLEARVEELEKTSLRVHTGDVIPSPGGSGVTATYTDTEAVQ